ncbi:hypothetical protein ACJJIR_09685 [Microbulbifer sp. SSSA008]|uniref:hypothetical protein n=1 Tax=Microbulbifer sp. SSSA008 TaxID=3243380 RepID=UPI00403A6EEC
MHKFDFHKDKGSLMLKVHAIFLVSLLASNVAAAETFDGDVGIGVTDPMATLHIQDSGSTNPAILITGASSSEGDIAVLNDDTFQLGNWKDSTNSYINWLQVDSVDVAESENNGYAPGTTKTRLRIMGDVSQSTIYHYSGFDLTYPKEESCDESEECIPYEYREELALKAHSDSVGEGSNGAGAHFYGDADSQHAGWLSFFTGGKSRLSINQQGRVGVGSENLLDDYENHFKGRFNIINPVNEPGLYIEGASSTEGDIAWKEGEYLQMGTWSTSTEFVDHEETIVGEFNEVVKITHTGNLSINNPVENDESPGYMQLDTSAGTPPESDCSSSSDVGRMVMHQSDSLLYVCSGSGWKNLAL